MPPLPIDGHTQLVGLVGWPVEHSMSPAMHNAAFDALGLNWRYVPLPVGPGRVEVAVRGLSAVGFRGANVTVPHKQAVIPALDLVAPDAQALGAVNTIVFERDAGGGAMLRGHNTDAAGFIGALRCRSFELKGTRAVVVGAGGAARAVVFGLMEAGAEEILVLNRSPERAQALVADLGESPPSGARQHSPSALRAIALTSDALIASAHAAHLLVNTTPVGMWPHTERSIWPDSAPIPSRLTVFDLVYNPLETKLLRQAHRSGARGVQGLGMLVRQGALSFNMWTGVEPPVQVMRAACERCLRSR
jgi:shikimate dehydrogenase